MKELTGKQRAIIEFIKSSTGSNGYPPTVREIGDHFGVTVKGAFDHLAAIEAKGFIKRDYVASEPVKTAPHTAGKASGSRSARKIGVGEGGAL